MKSVFHSNAGRPVERGISYSTINKIRRNSLGTTSWRWLDHFSGQSQYVRAVGLGTQGQPRLSDEQKPSGHCHSGERILLLDFPVTYLPFSTVYDSHRINARRSARASITIDLYRSLRDYRTLYSTVINRSLNSPSHGLTRDDRESTFNFLPPVFLLSHFLSMYL